MEQHAQNILLSLDSNVLILVLSYAGPKGTVIASETCMEMTRGSSRACVQRLWRFFFEKDFFQVSPYHETSPIDDTLIMYSSCGSSTNGSLDMYSSESEEDSVLGSPYSSRSRLRQVVSAEATHDCDNDDNWYGAYVYVAKIIKNPNAVEWLQANCLFADDGGHIAGYPAQNALSHGPECWCTRPGVNKNVDLVAELETPALITAFRFGNPEAGYTMPLAQALAIASFEPPDLYSRRILNHPMQNYDTDTEDITQQNYGLSIARTEAESLLSGNNQHLPGCAGVRFDLEDLTRAARGSTQDLTKIISCTPRLANYVHFKLLSSYHPDGATVNLDVRNLHVAGFPLPHLHQYLASASHTKYLQRNSYTAVEKKDFYPRRSRYQNSTGWSTAAGRDALTCYQRLHPDAHPDQSQRHNIHGLTLNAHNQFHQQNHYPALLDDYHQDFRPDIIRMMIVTTAGLMTHMPIDILALHPQPAVPPVQHAL